MIASTAPAADSNSANIDPRELAYYTRLADTWWDASGPFWPLHKLNTLRTVYIRQALCGLFGISDAGVEPLRGLNILDVGCGGGILSESMARLGARVHGIDVVAKNIEVARLHARRGALDIDYRLTSAKELARSPRRFDVVLNMEVVEHVPDVADLVADCARLTRPGGAMVLATINRTLASWVCAIVGAEYVLRWLPRGTHRWRRFVKPAELQGLLASNGFVLCRQTGVWVNPLTRQFSFTPRTAVNYMQIAQREHA